MLAESYLDGNLPGANFVEDTPSAFSNAPQAHYSIQPNEALAY